jgi:hypothetical protein
MIITVLKHRLVHTSIWRIFQLYYWPEHAHTQYIIQENKWHINGSNGEGWIATRKLEYNGYGQTIIRLEQNTSDHPLQ